MDESWGWVLGPTCGRGEWDWRGCACDYGGVPMTALCLLPLLPLLLLLLLLQLLLLLERLRC